MKKSIFKPMELSLFPRPRKFSQGHQRLDFSNARWVAIPPALSPRLKGRVLEFTRNWSKSLGIPLTLTAAVPHQGVCLLKVNKARAGFLAQGYKLNINNQGAVLEAGDDAGLYYGLVTFGQILEQAGGRLPALTISDNPDFPNRGFMMDVSRSKMPTMSTLKGVIDMMAALKLNQLQLYIEHTFAFSAHETVWRGASPFTAGEILELDDYCRGRYVELVPNFNSFGHFERWLKHPDYFHLAECASGYSDPWGRSFKTGSTLKPNQQSLNFLNSLWQEYLPNFTSSLFNAGCDETWELGEGWSGSRCRTLGKHRIYLDFVLKLNKLANKHGRSMMFWGDIILHDSSLIKELPGDITAMNWGYEASHPFPFETALFAQSGVPYYVCPGTSSWCSITGRTQNCLQNLAAAARSGLKNGARGYLITDWGDGGHHQYLPVSYLGLGAGAAFSWCWSANSKVDMARALDVHIFKDPAGIMGASFYKLGLSMDIIPYNRPNGTVFNDLLFGNIVDKPGLKHMPVKALNNCIGYLEGLSNDISASKSPARGRRLLIAEFRNAVQMARHGLLKALSLNTWRSNLSQLDRHIKGITTRHRQLWLSRNRPGGLSEGQRCLRNSFNKWRTNNGTFS